MEIDKNVPIWNAAWETHTSKIASQMEVDDSVLCSNATEAQLLCSSLFRRNKRAVQRKVVGSEQVRVWRIK